MSKQFNNLKMATQKQNTPGHGIEYEVLLPAYFALMLNTNKEVDDFTIRSNVQREFGNFDDIVINVTTKNGGEHSAAFQLKHKDRKILIPTSFEAKGDFNLKKYYDAFKAMPHKENYHFILFTNSTLDAGNKNQMKDFEIIRDKSDISNVFNTNSCTQNVYKFETSRTEIPEKEDYEKFFERFSLYTGQKHFFQLRDSLTEILKSEGVSMYVDFFRKWHGGEFTNKIIDKKLFNIQLVNLFLGQSLVTNYRLWDGTTTNFGLFEAAIMASDITIIDISKACKTDDSTNTSCNDTELLRFAKDNKIVEKNICELNKEVKLMVMNYFLQNPLIVDVDKCNNIYQFMELYRPTESKIKFVFLGKGVNAAKLSHCRVFRYLKDLQTISKELYENIIKTCRLSLQGRSDILLEDLVNTYEEIASLIETKHILKMLDGCCVVGNAREKLPQQYVPRTVTAAVFPSEKILSYSKQNKDLTIIGIDNNTELMRNMKHIKHCNFKVSKSNRYLHCINPKRSLRVATRRNCKNHKTEKVTLFQNS